MKKDYGPKISLRGPYRNLRKNIISHEETMRYLQKHIHDFSPQVQKDINWVFKHDIKTLRKRKKKLLGLVRRMEKK